MIIMYRFENMDTIDPKLFQHQNYFLVVIEMPDGKQAIDFASFEMVTNPIRIYLKSDGTVFKTTSDGWINDSDIGKREICFWSDVLSHQDFKFKELLKQNKTLEEAYTTFIDLYEITTGNRFDQQMDEEEV